MIAGEWVEKCKMISKISESERGNEDSIFFMYCFDLKRGKYINDFWQVYELKGF